MVTAFEILARMFSRLGDFQVQAFPAFGVERTGAPIQAFLRVAKKEILNRSNIYQPNLVVIFDESLLEQVAVADGLRPEGAVLINTERPPAAFASLAERVFTVPATRIALELGLGSKSLPIVNAAMIGAAARLFEADPVLLQQIVRENVPAKPEANAKAAQVAYNALQGDLQSRRPLLRALQASPKLTGPAWDPPTDETPIDPIEAPYWSSPLSKNKTGNWRLMTPSYQERTPPCNANCPAGTDVRAFVKLAGEGKFREAAQVIDEHNPFPAICGRVCPHFCEQNCNRNPFDDGVNIGAVERFLGDRTDLPLPAPAPIRFSERVAVIGSGPAGLTAALRLRRLGYAETVYEALPKAGGMMRTGIPKFRLPDEVLDREIDRIVRQGVRIELNRRVTVAELENDFDLVLTAVGSHIGSALQLDNDELVLEGISFLRKFKLQGDHSGVQQGQSVAIIGGGNTAIDVARTVLRLGAIPTIFYRRTRQEMPAIAHEVEEALLEGVRIRYLIAPIALTPRGKKLVLRLQVMRPGEPDESGRRRPVPVPGAERSLLMDHVITAIGQGSDRFAFDGQSVDFRQGRIDWDASVPVFAAGDMAWGGTVTEAIGSGNEVADEIHAFLRELPFEPEATPLQVVQPDEINFAYYLPAPRHWERARYARDLLGDFSERTKGLDEAEVVAETARCLHCGDCYSCGNCINFCPDAAIFVDEAGRLRIDYDYCKGCGICVQECPCSAMQFTLTETAS